MFVSFPFFFFYFLLDKVINQVDPWNSISFPSSGTFGIYITNGTLVTSPSTGNGNSNNTNTTASASIRWNYSKGLFYITPSSVLNPDSSQLWGMIANYNSNCDIPSPRQILEDIIPSTPSIPLNVPLKLSRGDVLILVNTNTQSILYLWMEKNPMKLSSNGGSYYTAESLVRFCSPEEPMPYRCGM